MRQLTILIIAAALMSTGTILGCYTVLRHPENYEYASHEASDVDGSCLDCHADSDYDHWSDPYYSTYYAFPAPWAVYYGQAWWYDPHEPYGDVYETYDDRPSVPLDGTFDTGHPPRWGWNLRYARSASSSPGPRPVASPAACRQQRYGERR